MIIEFKRHWGKYRSGTQTDAIRDGVATTLIRVGKAVLVKETTDEHTTRDGSQSANSGDRSNSRADNVGGSETAVVSGGVGHKPGRRTSQPNSSRS
jgi:hypothetical protein